MKIEFLLVLSSIAFLTFAYQEDNLTESNRFPSITPPPKTVSSGTEEWHIDHCNLKFNHPEALEKHILKAKNELLGLVFHSNCSKLSKLNEINIINQVHISVEDQEQMHHSIQDTDESYTLEILEGSILIKANQYIGVPRAIATLVQLIKKSKSQMGYYKITHIPIVINDSPRYQYRGMMMDTSRRYYSPEVLKEVINYMSLAKFNVFHWHIVDDDSFPLELSSRPSITENGAFSEDKVYTKAIIQDIVEYATALGIKVMPEFDNPGHTRAIGLEPTLTYMIRCFSKDWPYTLSGAYKIKGGPPTGVFDPYYAEAYDVTEGILSDLNDMFPEAMVHLGGDEVIQSCFSEDTHIYEFMDEIGVSTYDELVTYWIAEIRDRLTNINSGKQGVYWSNEDTFNLRYAAYDILMYWGYSSSVQTLKSIYPNNWIVFAPSDFFYLDCGMGNKYGGSAFCDPYKSWWTIYEFDPQLYLDDPWVIGGELASWSELSGDLNIHQKLWTRGVALTDMLWAEYQSHIDLVVITDRLEAFQAILEENGVPYSPITGHWCELNNDHCFAPYGTRIKREKPTQERWENRISRTT